VLEDALALGLAAAVGYLALLNLPLRRSEAKAKVERVAGNFAKARARRVLYKQANTEVCACALADATKQTRPAQGGCRGPEAGVRLCLMLPAEAV